MSLQRGCQFCGRRMRGVTPGALTILIDGQPLDAAIVLCSQDAIEVRRVLELLRQHSTVAQQARSVAVTQQITRIPDAVTEHYATLPPGTFLRPALEAVANNADDRRRWPRRRH